MMECFLKAWNSWDFCMWLLNTIYFAPCLWILWRRIWVGEVNVPVLVIIINETMFAGKKPIWVIIMATNKASLQWNEELTVWFDWITTFGTIRILWLDSNLAMLYYVCRCAKSNECREMGTVNGPLYSLVCCWFVMTNTPIGGDWMCGHLYKVRRGHRHSESLRKSQREFVCVAP